MDQGFFISYQVAAFLGGLVTVVGGAIGSLVVWAVNSRFNQMDRAFAEQTARMERALAELKDQQVRDKAEVMERMDRDKAEVMDRIDRVKTEVTVLVKESEERSEKRSAERWRAAGARADKQEARDEGRHSEIQAALREVNYRVGRLEGAIGASAGPAPRSGRHSPRQADEPSGATDSEMVVVTGVRATEPTLAAGQAHQAVPGPRQAAPQGDGTEPEPRTEDPPDTAR